MSCGSATCNQINLAISTDRLRGSHRGRLAILIERFERMLRRREDRRVLLELDDRTLRDVGLTRDQLVRAAMKSLWR